jgi:hypothetical protein
MPQGGGKNTPANAAVSGLAARNRRSNDIYVAWTVSERGEIFATRLLSEIAELGIDLGIEPLSCSTTRRPLIYEFTS